jgi:DNA-binding NarL/FixJ family response regulator
VPFAYAASSFPGQLVVLGKHQKKAFVEARRYGASFAMGDTNTVPVYQVYLVAEHRLLRESLVRLLRKKTDIRMVGESRHFDSSSEGIIASNCNILLLDSVSTPYVRKLLDELIQKAPAIKIVLFGMDEDPQIFLNAVRLGVSAYVVKDASAADIVAAVRGVAEGEAVCPPKLCMALFQQVAGAYRQQSMFTDSEARVKFGLTHRQSQLVALVARGLTNKEIAASLNLSEFTVKNHLRRIMKQVDVDSRHEAVDVIRAGGFLPIA